MRRAWPIQVAVRFCLSVFFPIAGFAVCPTSHPSNMGCVGGGATKVLRAHSVCREIVNAHASGRGMMVPLKSSTEWSAFIANAPTGVTFSTCEPCVETPGAACVGGAIYLGTLGNDHYMTTPGGCGDIPAGQRGGGTSSTNYWPNADFTPTCSGTDSLTKSWNNGTELEASVPGLSPYGTTIGTGYGAVNIDVNLGDANTSNIVVISAPAQGGRHAAAMYCDRLVFGGYSDWYLPNRFELNLMFTHRAVLPGLVMIAGSWYWSSTEYVFADSAWLQQFNDGNQDSYFKHAAHLVRCVRRF